MADAALESTHAPGPAPKHRPDYSRVTDAERVLILKLRDDGKTQGQIAQAIGCSQPTVHKILTAFADTTAASKLFLRGQSLRMARNIVEKGRAADHVAALKGLNVLEESQQSGVTIVVGGAATDVKVAVLLNAPSPLQLQAESETQQNP